MTSAFGQPKQDNAVSNLVVRKIMTVTERLVAPNAVVGVADSDTTVAGSLVGGLQILVSTVEDHKFTWDGSFNVWIDTSSGAAATLMLPSALNTAGRQIRIQGINSLDGAVDNIFTVETEGGAVINGATSSISYFNPNSYFAISLTFVCDGTNWWAFPFSAL